jgi:LytS/YehU family sensor histidine kinase
VDIAIDGAAMAARVPALLLQPLVENAVRHAVAPRESGGRIVVRAERSNGRLHLTVEDDGPGIAPGANRRGVGLSNTRERLAQKYGERHSLTLENAEPGGFRVRIDLPFDD